MCAILQVMVLSPAFHSGIVSVVNEKYHDKTLALASILERLASLPKSFGARLTGGCSCCVLHCCDSSMLAGPQSDILRCRINPCMPLSSLTGSYCCLEERSGVVRYCDGYDVESAVSASASLDVILIRQLALAWIWVQPNYTPTRAQRTCR